MGRGRDEEETQMLSAVVSNPLCDPATVNWEKLHFGVIIIEMY